MTNKIRVLLLLLAWTLCLGLAAFAEDPLKTEKYFDPKLGKTIEVVAGEILVKFKPVISSQSINALNAANQVRVIKRLPSLGVYELGGDKSVAELLSAYDPKTNPSVEYSEPNHICIALGNALSTTPNDPDLSKQWGITNIKAPQTWDITRGATSVIIAVVDSGIDLTHPDLVNRVMSGWDFVSGDNDPTDTYGHGTHVAGIIGAQANNSVGIAGVNWDCRLMPVRVLGDDGRGTSANFAAGVDYARNNGARVVNMSLALDPAGTQNATLSTAIANARAAGVVVVAAAGNDGDTSVRYPGADVGVICVAALDRFDVRASYSNANAYVDVCAPGGMGTGVSLHSSERVYSTMPTYACYMTTTYGYYTNYDTMHGTSMATPFVAGFAGLIFAQDPTLTNTQVENRIMQSVDHLGTGAAGTRNDIYGYGRINMYKAFNTTPPTPPSAPSAVQNRNQVVVSWTASPSTANVEKYYIYRSTSATGTFTLVGSASATSVTYTDTVAAAGTYYYKVSAVDAAGLESAQTTAASVTVVFSIDTITVYPNPFIIRTGSNLTFDGLNGTETIRIYTISGEQVLAITVAGATYNWNGRNTGNKQVARGVYLYLITRPTGEKRVGKFAVIG